MNKQNVVNEIIANANKCGITSQQIVEQINSDWLHIGPAYLCKRTSAQYQLNGQQITDSLIEASKQMGVAA
jgi:hypothetical protein